MADERRVVELVLKATGDAELKRIARDMASVAKTAKETQAELNGLGKAFKGITAGAAGLWVGNKIQQGLAALVSVASEAITEMNDLAVAGDAAGSALNKAAIGGAVELSNALEDVSAQIDVMVKDLVGGLAPALTTIVGLFGDAIKTGIDFHDVGRSIGQMLIDLTKYLAQNIAEIQAFATGIGFYADAVRLSAQAFHYALQGELAIADKFAAAGKAAMEAGKIYVTQYQAMGKARADFIQGRYDAATGAADAGGSPRAGAAKGGGKSAGGTGSAGRAREIEEENKYLELQKSTWEGINATIEENARLFEERDEARRREIEEQVKVQAAQTEWENQQKTQQEALEKARDQWGFLADAMGQATYEIIAGTEKIGTAMRKMAATIVAELVRIALTKLAMKILAGPFPGISFSANGNAFGSGGIISGPTMHGMRGGGIGIAGENGPEAILPLQRNAAGKLGVAAASGGSNVTVNNYASADVAVRDDGAGVHIDIIERKLADRVRRGGTALPGALEKTYRTGRHASAYT